MYSRSMDESKHLAEVASCISNPARAAILWSLIGGESRPASELAMLGNLSPQTASNHLKALVGAGLLEVSPSGRNKFYRLGGSTVAAALESLMNITHQGRSRDGIAQRSAPELVFARTCYDHLAGEVAVAILKRLLDRHLLRETDGEFALTRKGRAFFEELKIDVAAIETERRRFAYACLDWSHRVPHLGGALGAALLDWLFRSRTLVRSKRHRGVRVTDNGEAALRRLFGLRLRHDRCSLA